MPLMPSLVGLFVTAGAATLAPAEISGAISHTQSSAPVAHLACKPHFVFAAFAAFAALTAAFLSLYILTKR
jgi:hypothetical protein